MKKFILLLTGIISTMACIFVIISLSIILLYSEFKQGKLFVIIMFSFIIAGFGFTAFKSFKFVIHNKNVNSKQEAISAALNLPPTNNIIPHKSQKTDTESIESNKIQVLDNIKADVSDSKTSNIICKIDDKTIINENISYSIQLKHKNTLSTELESFNPKFHRTEQEENLSYNFAVKYGHEISLLEEDIKAFEKAKEFCYKKGKGGTIYFQDTWEYLHNSKKPCFSYLDNIKASLDKTIFKKNIVIPSIISTITDNDGILQKDIYKLLPDIDKQTIQQTIKELTAVGTISAIKKSNSYELHKF